MKPATVTTIVTVSSTNSNSTDNSMVTTETSGNLLHHLHHHRRQCFSTLLLRHRHHRHRRQCLVPLEHLTHRPLHRHQALQALLQHDLRCLALFQAQPCLHQHKLNHQRRAGMDPMDSIVLPRRTVRHQHRAVEEAAVPSQVVLHQLEPLATHHLTTTHPISMACMECIPRRVTLITLRGRKQPHRRLVPVGLQRRVPLPQELCPHHHRLHLHLHSKDRLKPIPQERRRSPILTQKEWQRMALSNPLLSTVSILSIKETNVVTIHLTPRNCPLSHSVFRYVISRFQAFVVFYVTLMIL